MKPYLIIAAGILALSACKKKKDQGPATDNTPASIGIWQAKGTGVSNHLIYPYFIDADTGYVAGYEGVIIKTTNGGASFKSLTSGVTDNLYSIGIPSPGICCAIGDNSTIIRTTNYGITWSAVTSPVSSNFRFIYFYDQSLGFAGGSDGNIIKTIDKGATWSPLTTGTTSHMYAIHFTSKTTGYAVGQKGTILKTIDGGSSWTPQITNLSDEYILTSVCFSTETTGFAVGGNPNGGGLAVLLKTTDGGSTWKLQDIGVNDRYLTCVRFSGPDVGYISGGNIDNNTSTLFKTTDGGLSWTLVSTATTRLTNMFVVDPTLAYVVGLDGKLLKGTK